MMMTDTKLKRKSIRMLEIIFAPPSAPKLAGFSKTSTVLDVRITYSITLGIISPSPPPAPVILVLLSSEGVILKHLFYNFRRGLTFVFLRTSEVEHHYHFSLCNQ